MQQIFKVLSIFTCFVLTTISSGSAYFVFKDEPSEGSTLLSYNFSGTSCGNNVTVLREVSKFKSDYEKLTHFTAYELHRTDAKGYARTKTKICNSRCSIVAKLSDKIRLISKFCISDDRQSKLIEMDSLLLLRTHLYFACEMSESQFEQFYVHNADECFLRHKRALDKCALSSFDLFFWEKSPDNVPSVVDLVHGAICYFNYDKMLTCSKSALKDCVNTVEVLQLQFDALKEVSLCGKQRTVSETLQDLSSESNGNSFTD